MVHQVGDAGDPDRPEREPFEQVGHVLRRRRHRHTRWVVDVVDEPDGHPALVRTHERAHDELGRLAHEADVVERELEAALRRAEELGDLTRDVLGGLSPVPVRPELDQAFEAARSLAL